MAMEYFTIKHYVDNIKSRVSGIMGEYGLKIQHGLATHSTFKEEMKDFKNQFGGILKNSNCLIGINHNKQQIKEFINRMELVKVLDHKHCGQITFYKNKLRKL